MRRHDREVTDYSEILRIIRKCDVCRLALNNDGYPYILPLNFGEAETEEGLVFYFHGAAEGMKYALLAQDNRVSFEMDCEHVLHGDKERGYCTMYYESVIGRGRVFEVTAETEKITALEVLCRHFYPEGFPFARDGVPRTRVLKLVVEQMAGKIKK